jgi:hypothetical protein
VAAGAIGEKDLAAFGQRLGGQTWIIENAIRVGLQKFGALTPLGRRNCDRQNQQKEDRNEKSDDAGARESRRRGDGSLIGLHQ